MDTTVFESFAAKIQTGDRLDVASDGLVPWAIRLWTRSGISHVGMFVRLRDFGLSELFIIQSLPRYGVSLIPARRYLSALKGEAWWTSLDHAEILQTMPNYQATLGAFMLNNLGRSYDFEGIAAYVLAPFHQARTQYYCSELLATAYQLIGLGGPTDISPGQMQQMAGFLPSVYLS